MTKQRFTAYGPSKTVPKFTSSELPPADVAGHDEWLLDESLTETFPASDPIAVSTYSRSHPPRMSLLRAVENDGAPGKIPDCSNGHCTQPGALETSIACDYCHTETAATVALSFEGADYIYHFCGPQCLDTWHKVAAWHDK